ncbi:hypothetical protein M427DRAFT_36392 [Gonapodya prolifera JEL478]|uniref:Uncharacterized protein n=1 Tax=Gonapodya prolifera (strain JEL478) TaxID=1344416 RepID=A0A139A2P2_GONPJ|nr:hypothetical protein M427DRAFT_36392 [Gonapodya prolifera JEL478]|eukprot:KXS10918.1 hypothetical protein M427DRAFT_36392 [Gonapodya prolifera JEL478]
MPPPPPPSKPVPHYPLGQDIFMPIPDLDSSPEMKPTEGGSVPDSEGLPAVSRMRSRRSVASRRSTKSAKGNTAAEGGDGKDLGGESAADVRWSQYYTKDQRRKSAAPSEKRSMRSFDPGAEKLDVSGGADLDRSRSKGSRRSKHNGGDNIRSQSQKRAPSRKRSTSKSARRQLSLVTEQFDALGSGGPMSPLFGTAPSDDGRGRLPSSLRITRLSSDFGSRSHGPPRSPQSPIYPAHVRRSPSPGTGTGTDDGSTRRWTDHQGSGTDGKGPMKVRNGRRDSRRAPTPDSDSSSRSSLSDLLADYEKSGSDGETAGDNQVHETAEARRKRLLARRKSGRSTKSGRSVRSEKSRSSSVEGLRRRKSADVRRQATLKTEMSGLVAMLERGSPLAHGE